MSSNNKKWAKPKNGKGANNKGKSGFKPVREQPKKDSNDPRINLDNARESRVAKDIESDSRKSNANDISEFNKNPELLKSAGSLPFASITGLPLQVTNGVKSVPGIMVLPYEPGLSGYDTQSAMNKAFQQIYSFVVHANSRNYKYEYPDLAMFTLAGIELFTAISEAIRVYGTAKAYTEENLYYGDAIIAALGFNPSDIRENLSQMWFSINNLIMQTKQIWVPNVMPILQRWIRYASEIYTDAEGKRSQIYLYKRNKFYALSEVASTNGTSLVPAIYNMGDDATGKPTWAIYQQGSITGDSTANIAAYDSVAHMYTWAEFESLIQTMINQLVASQDRGMIYGDILKAYGAERIFAMPAIGSEYTVYPQYNAEVLSQIENVTTCPGYNVQGLYQYAGTTENARLYQGIDLSFSTSSSVAALNGQTNAQILNAHFPGQPSPEYIMIATRHKVTGCKLANTGNRVTVNLSTAKPDAEGKWAAGSVTQNTTVGGPYLMPYAVGSEVVLGMEILRYDSGNPKYGNTGLTRYEVRQAYPIFTDTYPASTASQNLGVVKNVLQIMGAIQAFDWHPFIYQNAYSAVTQIGAYAMTNNDVHGDFDNFMELSDIDLSKLHAVAIYSLLGIPQLK